jgi:hypothetical protein
MTAVGFRLEPHREDLGVDKRNYVSTRIFQGLVELHGDTASRIKRSESLQNKRQSRWTQTRPLPDTTVGLATIPVTRSPWALRKGRRTGHRESEQRSGWRPMGVGGKAASNLRECAVAAGAEWEAAGMKRRE